MHARPSPTASPLRWRACLHWMCGGVCLRPQECSEAPQECSHAKKFHQKAQALQPAGSARAWLGGSIDSSFVVGALANRNRSHRLLQARLRLNASTPQRLTHRTTITTNHNQHTAMALPPPPTCSGTALLARLQLPASAVDPFNTSGSSSSGSSTRVDPALAQRLDWLWAQALAHLGHNPALSRTLTRQLVRVSNLALAPLAPRVLALLCPACGVVLLPGVTARTRLHPRASQCPTNKTRRRRRRRRMQGDGAGQQQQQHQQEAARRSVLLNELTYACTLCGEGGKRVDGVARGPSKNAAGAGMRDADEEDGARDRSAAVSGKPQWPAAAAGAAARAKEQQQQQQKQEQEEDFIPLSGGGGRGGFRGGTGHRGGRGGRGVGHQAPGRGGGGRGSGGGGGGGRGPRAGHQAQEPQPPRKLLDAKPRKRKGGASVDDEEARPRQPQPQQQQPSSSLGQLRGFLSQLGKKG